ncbi:MAG: VTT domain-containing protein [Candidatus Omnitrophota bacterium]|nr:VTT domain-containing protein [Candidatus Omnitrophota bacterium]
MKEKSASKNLFNFLALILILFFSWLLGRYCKIDTNYLQSLLLKFPFVIAGILFIFLYVVLSFFIWFVKDIFKVVGAIIFGAYLSSALVFLAEIINAVILFNLSHFLGRHFVENQLKGSFANLDKKISKLGFFGVFVLRAVPLIPFRFLDIAAGLTRVSFKEYFLACALGSPLRIFWLQFILAAVGLSIFKDTNAMAEYFLNNKIIFVFSLIYLALAIILGVFIKKSFLSKKGE